MKSNFKSPETFNVDVLVVGGGGAGLRAAIEAKETAPNLKVLVVSKVKAGFGNTVVAEGYLNVPCLGDEKDSPEIFARDIITAGRQVNNPKLVKIFTEEAKNLVQDLKRLGVKFNEKNGKPVLMTIPGHSYPRTVSTVGMGRGLTQPLYNYALNLGVQFKDRVLITKILRNDKKVIGAIGVDREGKIYVFNAKSIVLATGGAGWMYARSNNPGGMTGDGYALAYDLGLPLVGMEFVQFYPTYVFEKGVRVLVIYEKLVVQGATLRNSLGEDVIAKRGLTPSKVTRDVLSRILMMEILEGHGKDGLIELDLTTLNRKAVEDYLQVLSKRGFPVKKERVKVSPAAHFFMGGIKIDESCQTGLEGLYAAGEVVGGIHGANRLGGNALSEVFIFGRIAGKNAASKALEEELVEIEKEKISVEVERLEEILNQPGKESLVEVQQKLRETMWYKVGIVRNEESLNEALNELKTIEERIKNVRIENFFDLVRLLEIENMIKVGSVVSMAALHRKESRGSHYRTDYPEEEKGWIKNIIILQKNGKTTISTEDIPT